MESRIPFLPWLHLGCDLEDLDMAKRCEVGVWVFDVRNLQLLMEVFCFFSASSYWLLLHPPKSLRWQWGKSPCFFFPLSCSFSGVYMVYPCLSQYLSIYVVWGFAFIDNNKYKTLDLFQGPGVLFLHRNVHNHQLGVFSFSKHLNEATFWNIVP